METIPRKAWACAWLEGTIPAQGARWVGARLQGMKHRKARRCRQRALPAPLVLCETEVIMDGGDHERQIMKMKRASNISTPAKRVLPKISMVAKCPTVYTVGNLKRRRRLCLAMCTQKKRATNTQDTSHSHQSSCVWHTLTAPTAFSPLSARPAPRPPLSLKPCEATSTQKLYAPSHYAKCTQEIFSTINHAPHHYILLCV